ncbi:50S ribosomal protein L13 [Candidatus Profftella armatura (Diaphorina cf. continua)]|uniref:Large ribosomal subunit protein uL13 n=1 Tax=Candidatus Profftella armatura (Diaphorina cf. continua) TaxID=2661583 RepID=A0A7R6VYX0_9PROT|nr:50S ribosomal protein L13 [Candidatus Profftella armatura (Diaphorina cf. continua)]BCG49703.1 50S ribosomal protein L13 [Candidatus Profftella armatura (Diaphorina cf. continua)]
MQKTFSAKNHKINRIWFLIDAKNKILGRIATEIAVRLRGKHKTEYTPHIDTGDFIIVINTSKLRVTGKKEIKKIYYRHTGYPGGIRKINFLKMQEHFPGRVLQKAVKGMLPKGPLGYSMFKKLKIYGDSNHPHSAQKPQLLNF